MAVNLEEVVEKMIAAVKAAPFFTDNTIPVEPIFLPDQMWDIPDMEAVGVGIPSGTSTDDIELGQYNSGGPVPTSFDASVMLVVKSTGDDGVQTLQNRLFPIGQAAAAAIFGPNLNPDPSDEGCAFYAMPPVSFEILPYPGNRGDKGPALLLWTFRIYRINLEL